MAKGTKRARSRSRGPPGGGPRKRSRSRGFTRRRRVVRRRGTRARVIGPAVLVNPRRPRVETVTKYVYNAFQAYNATLTTAGVGFANSPAQYFIYQFDPSGEASAGGIGTTNYHVRVSGAGEEVGTLTSSGHAFPDWGSYSGIYQEYKVKYVRVVHTLRTTETGDNLLYPTLYMRAFQAESLPIYEDRFGDFATGNALNKLLEHTRVKKMTFNADHGAMTISYKLYPRVFLNGIGAFVKQRWQPMTAPRPLNGLVEVFEDPIPAGQLISTDLEWCVQFKTRV